MPGKYVTPFDSLVTCPRFFGKFPTMFGVLAFEAAEVAGIMVATEAVTLKGCPEVTLAIPPSCQRSTRRSTHPGALLSSGRPGPKGNSYVPLVMNACVRWKPSTALFNRWLLGSR